MELPRSRLVYHTLSTLLSTPTMPPLPPTFPPHPNLLSSSRSRHPITNSVSSSPQVILNYRRGVSPMSSDTTLQANFRGVLCRHCGKPVRVPNSVMRKESASQGRPEGDDSGTFHLISRVFVLRCRSCEKESVYAINQIVDCPAPSPSHSHKYKTAVA